MGRKPVKPQDRIIVVRAYVKKKDEKRLKKAINEELKRINNSNVDH